jgi:hypothetical protein
MGCVGGEHLHDPFQELAVSQSFGHFGLERLVIDTRELEEVLIKRAVVVILARTSGDFRTAFVEQTGKQCIPSE